MTLTLQNKSEIKATGHRTNGNCKPIMCIDTGEVYVSITDAAEKTGYKMNNISNVVTGRQKTCHGKRFCFISKVTEHLEEITASVRAREAKANAYEAIERQKNALKDAEEKVHKLEVSCSSMRERFEKEIEKLNKARIELYALQSNNRQINGKEEEA